MADMNLLGLTIVGGPSPDSHSDTSAEYAGTPSAGRSPASMFAGHDLRIT
jgi:hypothetical protein